MLMVGSGEEGLEEITKHKVDIVLLDIMLPGMDGFEVLEVIRKNYDGLPVIIVSALGDEKTCRKSNKIRSN